MEVKKLILLITLVLMLVGVVAASEVSNDTTTESTNTIVQDTQSTTNTVDTTVKDENINNNQIVKEEKNIKTASKTYGISDYNSLDDALTSDEYDTVTLNINSDITLRRNTELNSAINKLTINGNGNTIYGDDYQFLTIYGGTVTIKNIKIINCYSSYGGAIYNNNAKLTLINTTLENNKATVNGGAIENIEGSLTVTNSSLRNNYIIGSSATGGGAIHNNNGIVTIINSTFEKNNVLGDFSLGGGAIYNYEGTVNVKTSTLNNNHANDYGGAIYNVGNLSITNSILNNNYAEKDGGAIDNHDNLNITGNKFINNTADSGGALSISGEASTEKYINIKNNLFINNTASIASAIYTDGIAQFKTIDETVKEWREPRYITTINYDDNGNEISRTEVLVEPGYYDTYIKQVIVDAGNAKTLINNNTFKQNKANSTGKAIKNIGQATIKNNINDDISSYSSTILITGDASNITITSNLFDDGINYTKTVVQTTSGTIGEKLTLKATVTDTNNKKINEGNLIFKLNGITIKDNGKLTGSSNPLKVKVVNGIATATVVPDLDMRNANKLTAKYVGTDNYNASESSQVKIQVSQRNASIVVSSNVKTIKQGQVLTIMAKVYDTTNGKKSTNLTKFNEEFVYFKVNGITLKDSKGAMQKVKVVNGTATIKYAIPIGLSGVTDGKTFTVKNHTILAGFYNKNYKEDIRNTSTFQVERSNITITIANATVNNKTHKLSLTAIIKDYLGNKVVGPNKCIIKVNGVTLKNGTQPIYYFASYGVLNVKDINIPAYNKYTSIEIVTQDRLAYKNQRNNTTKINIIPKEELKVVIANKNYDLVLNNNTASGEFKKLLPQTYTMSELNGNEKYVYLNTSLTSNPINVGKINAGDLMLYQNNCIVLFYKTFNTTYSYTPLGHVNNLGNLGSSDVIVKFVKS